MSNISVYQSVSVAHNNVWCVEGFDPDFRPGNFLPPDRFLAVNPYGYEDNNTDPDWRTLNNEMFHDPDVVFYLVTASLCDLQHALFKQGKLDAEDHFECFNGGLYALWAVNATQVLIAGMDNGGEQTAVCAAHDVAHEFHNTKILEATDFRFSQKSHSGIKAISEQIVSFRQHKHLSAQVEQTQTHASSKSHKI